MGAIIAEITKAVDVGAFAGATDRYRNLCRDLWKLGNANRVPLIGAWWAEGRIDADELRALLAEFWWNVEFPSNYGTDRLVRLFRAAGFVTDTVSVRIPTVSLVVYRGVALDPFIPDRKVAKGVSWTTDEQKAEWFARRLQVPGRVYVAVAPPAAVLGIFRDRGESEVVVAPRRLQRLRALRDVPILAPPIVSETLSQDRW